MPAETVTTYGWPGWMTPRIAAAYASVSISTIHVWLNAGLPSLKPSSQLRLIRREDLDAYLSAMVTSNNCEHNKTNKSEAA
jgi:excisionase family DNA binding protein